MYLTLSDDLASTCECLGLEKDNYTILIELQLCIVKVMMSEEWRTDIYKFMPAIITNSHFIQN